VSALIAAATLAALLWLPRETDESPEPNQDVGFLSLLARPDLLRIYAVAFCAFFVFSGLFNYLPFYLSGPPFGFSTNLVTFMYLAYLIGVGDCAALQPGQPSPGQRRQRYGVHPAGCDFLVRNH
jgi:MFS transporter, YNFM family, putative membrane transport protein